jgi:tRNA(His) 5'-end guanylyltransferase
MDKTNLGDRMKDYENAFRKYVPEKSYIVLRLDGKAFHTYTKGLNKPYDYHLMEDMAETAQYLCENIQGAWWGYTQSDEITLVLTPFAKENSDSWFKGNIQKMVSISAAMATAKFNILRREGRGINKIALFDSRVFILPSKEEVMNCLIWRQRDAIKNSISMAAQSVYSHAALNKKNGDDQLQMLLDKDIDWNDYPTPAKCGTIVRKYRTIHTNDGTYKNQPATFERTFWKAEGSFIFNVDETIDTLIPSPGFGYGDTINELVPEI